MPVTVNIFECNAGIIRWHGSCGDCLAESCICNQILITRNSRIEGRIKLILVGEDLGL